MRQNKVSGFTLIELLVVIAIIAVLAAIIFPTFAQARRKSYQSTCLSNLKQIGAATLMYAQDYNDHFPFGCDNTDHLLEASWPDTEWADDIANMKLMPEVLLPYTKSKAVWHCPADIGFTITGLSLEYELDGRPSAFEKFGMSYHVYTMIPLKRETISGIVAQGIKKTFGPAEIPFVFDANGNWHGGDKQLEYRYDALYCDGHAANKPREAFMEPIYAHIGPDSN